MSEQQTSSIVSPPTQDQTAQAAPPPPVAPAAQTAAISPPAAPPVAPPPDEEPAWLAKRLDRERRSMLRHFGVECGPGEDPNTKLAEYRAQQQHVQQTAASAEQLRTSLAGYAGGEVAKLLPEQQAAVKALAGDDPGKQLDAIRVLRPTWGNAPAVPATTPQTAAPAQPAAPTSTATPPAAPPPTTPVLGDHLGTYQRLEQSNPMAARLYYAKNAAAIIQAQKRAS